MRREGRSGLALLCFGTLLASLAETAEALDATVVDMRFVKPLDVATLTRVALRSRALITVEENAVAGGAGSAVAEALDAAGIAIPRLAIGIPDRFIEHGSREDCLGMAGLSRGWPARPDHPLVGHPPCPGPLRRLEVRRPAAVRAR